jgi:hypothetical protein
LSPPVDIPVWVQLYPKTTSPFDPYRTLAGSVTVCAQAGLGEAYERLRRWASKGKRAAQLETVSEPGQGERNDLTSPNDCAKLSKNAESNLRAINRAPEIVADLYRDGLINQVDAAREAKRPR